MSTATEPSDSSRPKQTAWRLWLSRAYVAAIIALGLVLLSPMLKGAYYGAFPPEKPSPENLPAWRASYAAALEESGRTGKRVLIDFTASWCPPCRVMEAEVWPDEKVRAAIAQHVIPLQLDIDEPDSNAAARKYGIQSIPTLVIVDAHGTELARGNFMSASGVVAFVTENAGSGS